MTGPGFDLLWIVDGSRLPVDTRRGTPCGSGRAGTSYIAAVQATSTHDVAGRGDQHV